MANTPTREEVYQAFFDLVSQSSAFVTASRKFRLWTDVPLEARPALFVLERNEDSEMGARATVAGVVTYNVDVFIYTNAQDAAVPASIMNPLLDALDAALAPPYPGAKQTLGGKVYHVWNEGPVLKDNGDLDGQGLAVVPCKIRAMAP